MVRVGHILIRQVSCLQRDQRNTILQTAIQPTGFGTAHQTTQPQLALQFSPSLL